MECSEDEGGEGQSKMSFHKEHHRQEIVVYTEYSTVYELRKHAVVLQAAERPLGQYRHLAQGRLAVKGPEVGR